MASRISALNHYRPQIEYGETAGWREVAEYIASHTGLGKADILRVLLELGDAFGQAQPLGVNGLTKNNGGHRGRRKKDQTNSSAHGDSVASAKSRCFSALGPRPSALALHHWQNDRVHARLEAWTGSPHAICSTG